MQLTLTVNNLFNTSPSFYGAADTGFTNGSTLGRLIQAGFTAKFCCIAGSSSRASECT